MQLLHMPELALLQVSAHRNGPLSNLIHIPVEAMNKHSERVRKSLTVHEGFRSGPADLE